MIPQNLVSHTDHIFTDELLTGFVKYYIKFSEFGQFLNYHIT